MDLQPNKTDAISKPITETRISASEWNQLVGSCMEFITAAGFTPDAEDNEQFLNAFIQIAQNLGAIGANVDLSNLSATGEGKFDAKAGTDLGNLTATGKEVVSNLPMPSNKYDDLTLGSSGSKYTMPADGWLYLDKTNGTADRYVLFKNSAGSIGGEYTACCPGTNTHGTLLMPVKKGDEVTVSYNASGATNYFRFIYAQGEK